LPITFGIFTVQVKSPIAPVRNELQLPIPCNSPGLTFL
jgi:hypothetical protein